MFYTTSIEIPPDVFPSTPVERTIGLTLGVIDRVLVGFPFGCAGLVHVTLWDKGWQILPWTQSTSLYWDDYMFDLPIHYPLISEPFEVTVRCWNFDDMFYHTVFVGICMTEGLPDEEFINFLRALKEEV